MSVLTIGKLANQAGVTVDAIRYYERCDLLPASGRSPSGYRLYHEDVVHRVQFIRHAQTVGFSLNEIRELLALRDDPGRSATEVKHLVHEKIADVDARIRSLERIRDDLQGLDKSCPGRGSTESCPILSALEQTEADESALHCTKQRIGGFGGPG